MKQTSIRTLAKVAILGAIAFVLMYFDFPLFFAPSFYKIDFSEVAVLIGGFAMGPLPAVAIEALKIVLKLLFKSTDTAYVGELANFIIGCAFCVPAAVLYRRNKTRKTAILGLVVGTISMTIVGLLMNYFVLLPAYSYFYHLDMDVLVGMGSAIIPLIKDRLSFVLLATTPFNLFKGLVVSILTMLLYKHISPLLHK